MKKRKELKEIADIYSKEYKKKSFKELLSLKYPIEFEITHNNKQYKVEIIRVIEDESCSEFIDIVICVSNGILSALIPATEGFTKTKYKQYSVVKLKNIKRQFSVDELSFDKRAPKVGDIATIIEIYEKPTLGYELECSDENRITEWLFAFSPEEVEFELVEEIT
jgi:hypothetical protein